MQRAPGMGKPELQPVPAAGAAEAQMSSGNLHAAPQRVLARWESESLPRPRQRPALPHAGQQGQPSTAWPPGPLAEGRCRRLTGESHLARAFEATHPSGMVAGLFHASPCKPHACCVEGALL